MPLAHDEVHNRPLGYKQYELKDHLGNVRAVISDRRTPEQGTDELGNPISYYQGELMTYNHYYPFGMDMASWSSDNFSSYRYGFNGKEKDDKGEFGSKTTYDYGFRIYNPGIAKFLSVDPLTKSYPMLTPYQFASNTPIWGIDLDGLELHIYYFKMFKENGEEKIKKIHAYDIDHYYGADGNKVKYDESWILRQKIGYENADWRFSEKKDFNEWDGGLLSRYNPLPEKSKSDMLWGSLYELADQGTSYDVGEALQAIIKSGQYNKLVENYKYAVIVGSFQNEDNAKKFAIDLKKKYSDANIRILPKREDGLYRVVAGDHKVGNEADAFELRNVAKDEGYEDAWILVTPKEDLEKAEEIK